MRTMLVLMKASIGSNKPRGLKNMENSSKEEEDSAQVSRRRYTWLADRSRGKLQ
jgi:hypothetical protein